jgi:hypoxanthine phosphoribosyltransferase
MADPTNQQLLDSPKKILRSLEGVLLTERNIKRRIKKLALSIKSYLIAENLLSGKPPILLGVLNGSFIFMADLGRAMASVDCEADFIKLSSYGKMDKSSKDPEWLKELSAEIKDRVVIVVEDIVDTGYSVESMRERINEFKPKKLIFVSLLIKNGTRETFCGGIQFSGFWIPNLYVIGYGLDSKQGNRFLPNIYFKEDPEKVFLARISLFLRGEFFLRTGKPILIEYTKSEVMP